MDSVYIEKTMTTREFGNSKAKSKEVLGSDGKWHKVIDVHSEVYGSAGGYMSERLIIVCEGEDVFADYPHGIISVRHVENKL